MIQFSNDSIQHAAEHFDETTLHRGLRYAMEERVVLVKHDDWPVVAKVRGTTGYIVTLDYGPANRFLQCECSCPVMDDCKHAAATAIVYYQQLVDQDEEDGLRYQGRAVGEWLASLGDLRFSPTSATKAKSAERLVVYILDRANESIRVSFHRTSLLKRGGYGKSTRLASIAEPSKGVPHWMQAGDLRIISAIRALTRATPYEAVHPIDLLDEQIFQELCNTGRFFWNDVHSLPLRWGPEREERLQWRELDNSFDELKLDIDPELLLIPARATLYLDAVNSILGIANLGISPGVAQEIANGPPVPRSMVKTAEKSLRSLLLPSMREVLFPVDESEQPQPPLETKLHISVERLPSGYFFETKVEAVYGEQHFELAEWDAPAPNSTIVRDMAEEGRLYARLSALTREAPINILNPLCHGHKDFLHGAQHIAHIIYPTLISEGWTCTLSDDFPADLPIMAPNWVEHLEPVSQGLDWFEMGLGVSIQGRTIELLPILLQAIADGRLNFSEGSLASQQPVGINLTLPSGELVYVPGKRLERWIHPLIELRLRGLDENEKLKLPSFTVADMLETDGPRPFSDTKALDQVRSKLESLLKLKATKEGKGFTGTLRGYQREGLAWLHFLHSSGYGGLLCDDMGLGKTVQLLAFFDRLRSSRKLPKSCPILVVAPRSVLGNWQAETSRFTPKLSSTIHWGNKRSTDTDLLCSTQVVITSYQTLLRDIKLFAKVTWTCIVFDEAQVLKNPTTKLRRCVVKLRSISRFCVTGTPIENHLLELWSQVDLVMPGLLGSKTTFQHVFRTPIEKHGSHRALTLLQKRIRPFLLRRTKEDVDIDLPPKTEIIEKVPLDAAQRDLYESLRVILDQNIRIALKARGVQSSSLVILDAILRLRQCCCDPRLVNLPQAKKVRSSAKLERLMSMLDQLTDAGRSTLVFSQFTSMLALIEEECIRQNIGYVKLTGQTRDRESVIERFQKGEVPVFLISLKAGGVGLNLTQADTVIHYDPWWNPAVERQATDRAHRIGQTKSVMVYKIVAEQTLEERICVLQEEKQRLTDTTLSEGGLSHFGAEDLQAFFQSL